MKGLAKVLNYRTAVLIPVVLFVGCMAVIPPFYLLWSSFKPISLGNISDFSFTNFTLENYTYAFSDPSIFIMLFDSFFFAGGSMMVALLFGGLIAFLVERTNVPPEEPHLWSDAHPFDHAQYVKGHRLDSPHKPQ